MSNRANLERQKVTKIKTGETLNQLLLFDDYGENTYIVESIPDDDLECLIECIKQHKEEQYRQGVLDNTYESEKGISIDGTWYDWEEIYPLFKEYWEDE
jgi:hypothetical protein